MPSNLSAAIRQCLGSHFRPPKTPAVGIDAYSGPALTDSKAPPPALPLNNERTRWNCRAGLSPLAAIILNVGKSIFQTTVFNYPIHPAALIVHRSLNCFFDLFWPSSRPALFCDLPFGCAQYTAAI
jgi:hypothetical protein